MNSPSSQNALSKDTNRRIVVIEEIKDIENSIKSLRWQICHNENSLQKTIDYLKNMTLEEKLMELRANTKTTEKQYLQHQINRDKQEIKKEERKLNEFKKEFKKLENERKQRRDIFVDKINKVGEWL